MGYNRKIVRVYQVIKYICALLISRFYRNENIWILAERGTDARDNAYWLFLYLKNNSNDVSSYYVISNDSPDIVRLKNYSDSLVEYGTFRHYLLYCRAKALISTHIYGFAPVPSLFIKLDKYFKINKRKITVMLQHGVTKDNIPSLHFSNTKLNLMICGAKPEYDFMKANYGYPEDNLQYLGFCRFDNLQREQNPERIILLMPTWRQWLSKDNIVNSQYIHKYIELLSNKDLITILNSTGYKLYFYPHHEVQPYLDLFNKHHYADSVIIADKFQYDVQTLLQRSSLLITDYSSVFFDFAYMKKPIIFYQFDKEKYRNNHYSEGYFDYDNSFGPVVSTINDLTEQVKQLIEFDCALDSKYSVKVDEYFPLSDKENCVRTYNCIMSKLLVDN